MIGRFQVLWVLAAMLAFGCAKPKYDNSKSGDSPSQDAKAMTCDLEFAKSKYCLSWSWQKKPSQQETGVIEFYVFTLVSDAPAQPVDLPQSPKVVLWMPDMGHGSAPTHVEFVEVGHYLAKDVMFVMPGRWQIKFQLKYQNESGDLVDDEAIAEVSI